MIELKFSALGISRRLKGSHDTRSTEEIFLKDDLVILKRLKLLENIEEMFLLYYIQSDVMSNIQSGIRVRVVTDKQASCSC